MSAHVDTEALKAAVAGRWLEVLSILSPDLHDAIATVGTTKHCLCPVHGGRNGDAFRLYANAAETGGAVCNTCGAFHDGFALLEWLYGWDFVTVKTKVADALGLVRGRPARAAPRAPQARPVNGAAGAPAPARIAQADRDALVARLWAETQPDSGPVAAYLRHRGLSGAVPAALRLHPALEYRDDRGGLIGTFPAMVARLDRPDGGYGLHRTYLAAEGAGKAPVDTPKKTLGRVAGGVVRLAEPTDTLALAEGIETALAVMEATELPTWAAGSAGTLAAVSLPATVRRVIVAGDRDASGTGQQQAHAAAERFRAEGREARVAIPTGHKDWLDVLVAEGPVAVRRSVLAPAPAETVEAADAWEPPVPFEAAAGAPLPLDAFPAVLADWIAELAATHQVPADLPALLVLGVVAAAAARRAEVQVGGLFREPLGLYVAAVAESGERKGPALRDVLFPLEAAERDRRAEVRDTIEQARRARAVAEARLKHLTEKAAKATDPTEAEALRADLARLELPPVPPLPRLLVGNITPEKLEAELADQGGALGLASEEAGSVFDIAAGRYAKDGRGQLDTLLKAYDGGRLTTDRMTRAGVDLERPALSILLTPQPGILRSFREVPDFRDRGLLGRFLYVIPRTLVGSRLVQTRARNANLRDAYARAIWRVLALPRPGASEAMPTVALAGAGFEIWRASADRLEGEQAEGERLATIRDWASKHAARVARIAAGFHLLEPADRDPWTVPIQAETVARAWRLGDALTEHALVAYGIMGSDPVVDDARAVLAWIARTARRRAAEGAPLTTFTKQEVWQGTRGRFGVVEPLEAALARLRQHGYLREVIPPRPSPAGGRPAAPSYLVTPHFDPYNPYNCPPASLGGGSRDCRDTSSRIAPAGGEAVEVFE